MKFLKLPRLVLATLFFTGLTLAILGLGAWGVNRYDRANEKIIAPGVQVGGVDIGGMNVAAARRKLSEELYKPYLAPVVLRSKQQSYRLKPQSLHLNIDTSTQLQKALQVSRAGSTLERAWRGFSGESIDKNIPIRVQYSQRKLNKRLTHIRKALSRPARDASLKFSGAGFTRVSGRTGRALDIRPLRRKLDNLITTPHEPETIKLRVQTIQPKVTKAKLTKKYPVVIMVNKDQRKLRLYKNLRLSQTYPVTIGQAGFETPVGLYDIQNKAVDPAWSVPEWGGSLAGQVVPGGIASNPLKARWLGIYDGVGIHGTDQLGEIGLAASHGCVRMLIPDVVRLYEQVPVGAPIYIS